MQNYTLRLMSSVRSITYLQYIFLPVRVGIPINFNDTVECDPHLLIILFVLL